MRRNLRPEGKTRKVLKGLHSLTVFSRRSKEEAGLGWGGRWNR